LWSSHHSACDDAITKSSTNRLSMPRAKSIVCQLLAKDLFFSILQATGEAATGIEQHHAPGATLERTLAQLGSIAAAVRVGATARTGARAPTTHALLEGIRAETQIEPAM